MQMQIGERIKELRKERRMTQEQLADMVGISFQAVSKWENNLALPDITLVPVLARIFSVSTDELFSFNKAEIQAEIESITWESYKYREDDPAKAREILEKGLEKYPENDILLNNLLYTLNYSKNPDETIKIASKLIDKTTEADVKFDALRFLAYAYNAKGDKESAAAALEQIPEIYFTKLSEMAFILEGEAKYLAAEKQKWISFETLLQMTWKIAECYIDECKTAEAREQTQRALALIDAMKGEEKIERFDSYKEFFEKQLTKIKDN